MIEDLRVKREINIVNQILEVRDCSDWDTNFLTGVREQLYKNRELSIKQRGIMFDYLMDTARKIGHVVETCDPLGNYHQQIVLAYTEEGFPILQTKRIAEKGGVDCRVYKGNIYIPSTKRTTHQYARAAHPGAMTATGVTKHLTEEEAAKDPCAMEKLPWTERTTYVDPKGEEVTR